jgi:hypothetical protein
VIVVDITRDIEYDFNNIKTLPDRIELCKKMLLEIGLDYKMQAINCYM